MHSNLPRVYTHRLALRFVHCTSGANAVEFAIVAPLLFMLVAGILVYGLYFGTAHAVQQLAADAARASVAGLSDTERSAIAEQHVAKSSPGYLLLRPGKLKVSTGVHGGDADLFVVTLVYDASDLPVFGLEKLVPVPEPTIRRTSTIRRGGY